MALAKLAMTVLAVFMTYSASAQQSPIPEDRAWKQL
jgi:hypothetical protein